MKGGEKEKKKERKRKVALLATQKKKKKINLCISGSCYIQEQCITDHRYRVSLLYCSIVLPLGRCSSWFQKKKKKGSKKPII